MRERHCQSCGATDALNGDQGYTACCNERVVDECDKIDCGHGEYAKYWGEWNGREWVAVSEESAR